jgi:diguanylate cyclase (GGDEF)-like protein
MSHKHPKETEEIQTLTIDTSADRQIPKPVLLCLSGVLAGKLLALELNKKTLFIGRDNEQCDICLDSPEISRIHARIEQKSDNSFVIYDLDSTNGVFINNQKTKEFILAPNDKIRFGPHIVWKFFYQDQEEFNYYQQLYYNTSEDYLTGAYSRRYFMRIFSQEWAFAKRHKRALSLALLDLDYFKKVNDTYGHLVGDQILTTFVLRVKQQIRQEDLMARYGGEEFLLLLKEVNAQGVFCVLERIRKVIADQLFATDKGEIRVTVSIGSITYSPEQIAQKTAEQMIEEADEQLYKAKNAGRNCIRYIST